MMNIVQEVDVAPLQKEEIHRQTLLLLLDAKNFSQFHYPAAVEHCKTWDEKFYIRRENQRITDFLSSTNLWLSEGHWDQSAQPIYSDDGSNSGNLGNPPSYQPERKDLDYLLPSEFIEIRDRVEKFNNRLNSGMNINA